MRENGKMGTYRLRRASVRRAALPEVPRIAVDEADTPRLVTESRIPQYRPVAEHPDVLHVFHRARIHRAAFRYHFVRGSTTASQQSDHRAPTTE